MNIENMKTLIGQLERLPDEKFWMPDFIVHPENFDRYRIPRAKDCGTVACIAGWVCLFNGQENNSNFAREWLGLRKLAAYDLFYGVWAGDKPLTYVTCSDAIGELKRLLAEAELGAN